MWRVLWMLALANPATAGDEVIIITACPAGQVWNGAICVDEGVDIGEINDGCFLCDLVLDWPGGGWRPPEPDPDPEPECDDCVEKAECVDFYQDDFDDCVAHGPEIVTSECAADIEAMGGDPFGDSEEDSDAFLECLENELEVWEEDCLEVLSWGMIGCGAAWVCDYECNNEPLDAAASKGISMPAEARG